MKLEEIVSHANKHTKECNCIAVICKICREIYPEKHGVNYDIGTCIKCPVLDYNLMKVKIAADRGDK